MIYESNHSSTSSRCSGNEPAIRGLRHVPLAHGEQLEHTATWFMIFEIKKSWQRNQDGGKIIQVMAEKEVLHFVLAMNKKNRIK